MSSTSAESRNHTAGRRHSNHAGSPPWSWFFSMRVGIVLLIALTIASIIGTFFEELEEAQALVFYTWWYKLLLLLLIINMGCATIRNISTKIAHAYRRQFQHQPPFYNNSRPSAEMEYSGTPEEFAEALRTAGHHVTLDGNAGYAHSGIWGLWGAPLAHFGLIVVLIGGFLSSWVAKEGFVQVLEGHHTETMKLRVPGQESQPHPLGFALMLDDFATEFFPQTTVPAFFRSTITAFVEGEEPRTETVEVNTSPKIAGWRLHQTSYQEIPQLPRYEFSIRNEDEPTSLILELSPGQTRYLPGMPGKAIRLNSVVPLDWEIIYDNISVFESAPPAPTGDEEVRLIVQRFEPDFVMDRDREIRSRSEEPNNPALLVTVEEGGRQTQKQWLFGNERLKAMMHPSEGDYSMDLRAVGGAAGAWSFTVAVESRAEEAPVGVFELGDGGSVVLREALPESSEPREVSRESEGPWRVEMVRTVDGHMSVLSITRNPIIPLIYAGCVLMMLGLIFGFFVVRRRVWFVVDPDNGLLRLAAAYRFPCDHFDRRTQSAIGRLAENGKIES